MTLKEMYQKKGDAIAEARKIVDKADEEKRDLTAEEEQRYNALMTEATNWDKRAKREEALQAEERALRDPVGTAEKPMPEGQSEKRGGVRASKEYNEAFWAAFRNGFQGMTAEQHALLTHKDVRALSVGTATAGGYTVPDEFERQLIMGLENQNVMRGLATVITTSSGTLEIPVVSGHGTASWLAEAAAFTPSDETFGQKTLSAYKAGTIILVSEELLNDSAFNLEQYIVNEFARRIGRLEEAAFVNGDGTGKPTGVIQGATLGKTGATGQTTSVTSDDLIDTFHALGRPYRQNATWMMADGTAKAIRKLKDADNQYIWQPGLQAGQPDRLLGRPVAISDDVPAMAASAKSILFGDYRYYWIADRQGRVFQRLNELYAANGQVGFRVYQRVDGKLILPEAVVYYQNSAT